MGSSNADPCSSAFVGFMSYQDCQIMDSSLAVRPQSPGGMVPYEPLNGDITAQQAYEALPVHMQSNESWGLLKRATPNERAQVYLYWADNSQTHNYDNRTYHHNEIVQAPPQVIYVEREPQYPTEWQQSQPTIIENHIHVEPHIEAHGGNAHAYSHSESDGESGRPHLWCAACVVAALVLAVVAAGE